MNDAPEELLLSVSVFELAGHEGSPCSASRAGKYSPPPDGLWAAQCSVRAARLGRGGASGRQTQQERHRTGVTRRGTRGRGDDAFPCRAAVSRMQRPRFVSCAVALTASRYRWALTQRTGGTAMNAIQQLLGYSSLATTSQRLLRTCCAPGRLPVLRGG